MSAEGLKAVESFWKEFGVARGVESIHAYAHEHGHDVSTHQVAYALRKIKSLRDPAPRLARLQEDVKEHNAWRFQRKGRRAEVLASDLIPFAPKHDEEWQADLIYMNANPQKGEIGWVIAKGNEPKYIFALIHVASRRLYARAIKNTARGEIEQAFFSMLHALRQDGLEMRALTTDGGPEFSTWFKTLLNSLKIEHTQPPGSGPGNPLKGFTDIKPSGAGDKTYMALIERVNQSLRTILSRYRTENNYTEKRWWKFLERAVDTYNTTLHMEIGGNPEDISESATEMQRVITTEKQEKSAQIQNLKRRRMLDYNINEAVALRRELGEHTFAGKVEGKVSPQQRFVVMARRGSRYLLAPVNRGAGNVRTLVPPQQCSKKQGVFVFWAPYHALRRLPAYEQPTKTHGLPQDGEERENIDRVLGDIERRNRLIRTRARTRTYTALRPELDARDVENNINSMEQEDRTSRKYATRARARENAPISSRTRGKKQQ